MTPALATGRVHTGADRSLMEPTHAPSTVGRPGSHGWGLRADGDTAVTGATERNPTALRGGDGEAVPSKRWIRSRDG